MPSLTSDIVGRVKRLPLKPSDVSALIPLHEAISNSVHSVQERFGDEASQKGKIEIEVYRRTNGGGDTHPTGGKGVGRLGWLKVFQNVSVASTFFENDRLGQRAFDFVLSDKDQVKEKAERPPQKDVQTKITLQTFADTYGSFCPARTETLAQRIIGHFLPVFAAETAPAMTLTDQDQSIDLREYFSSKIRDKKVVPIQVELSDTETISLTLRHIRCDKSIRPRGAQFNCLFLAAHDRTVVGYSIDEQLGLKLLKDEAIYIGCVLGQ
jgi:hypothetical protein